MENSVKLADRIASVYEGFLENDTYPYHIYVYFDKIDNVKCEARFDMREDNLIRFIIYSKTITCKSRGYESVILYSEIYCPSVKELKEKKIDRERIRKYTKKLLEDIPKLRLGTNGYLEIAEEADVIDEINNLFIGMPNVVYEYKKCLKCDNNTNTKTPCCETHLCRRCWFDIDYDCDHPGCNSIICPKCDEDISEI